MIDLEKLVKDGEISEQTVVTAISAYTRACMSNCNLQLPSYTSFERKMFCYWDSGIHHLEMEVLENEVSWFYRNRQTEEIWSYESVDILPLAVTNVLKFFCEPS